MARPAATPAPQQVAEPGVIGGLFLGIVKVLGWLILGLVFSILAEWLGMTFWWPQEGTHHSRRMLEAELGYLTASVPRSLVSADPARFARRLADLFYHYWVRGDGNRERCRAAECTCPAARRHPLENLPSPLRAGFELPPRRHHHQAQHTRYGGVWLTLTRPMIVGWAAPVARPDLDSLA